MTSYRSRPGRTPVPPKKALTSERYQKSENIVSEFNLSQNIEPTSVFQQVKDYFISRDVFDERRMFEKSYLERDCRLILKFL